jgi:hypothetical protein
MSIVDERRAIIGPALAGAGRQERDFEFSRYGRPRVKQSLMRIAGLHVTGIS